MTETPPDRRERPVALLLLIAADVMFWVALVGAALVLRGTDPATFDAHRADLANSLYSWILLPALMVAAVAIVPALVRPRDRSLRFLAAAGGLVPVAALVLTLLIWSRPAAQLVELDVDGRLERFAVEVKPLVDPTGRDGRFAAHAPEGWHTGLSVPNAPTEQADAVITRGRILAQAGNGPSRHHFFAVAWIAAVALAGHWILASVLLARWGASPTHLWTVWSSALSVTAMLLLGI